MKKKDVFNYGMECFERVRQGPSGSYDCQIEDWLDDVESMAAALKASKDFNIREEFYNKIRKVFS